MFAGVVYSSKICIPSPTMHCLIMGDAFPQTRLSQPLQQAGNSTYTCAWGGEGTEQSEQTGSRPDCELTGDEWRCG